jgi:hypothetical protein
MKHVWLAEFCECTHETSFEVLAVCLSRARARTIIRKHKANNKELVEYRCKPYYWSAWRVRQMEVQS